MLLLSGCESSPAHEPFDASFAIPENPIPELAPRLRDRPEPKEASAIRRIQPRGAIQVRVEDGADKGEPVVVAVFDPAGVRLAHAKVDRAPFETTFDHLPAGELQVCLGRCLECVRLSYFLEARVTVREGVPTRRTFRVATRPLQFSITASREPGPDAHRPTIAGIPVLLHRIGDPTWRYRRPFSKKAEESIVRTDALGVVAFQDLGPGRYRIELRGFDVDAIDVPRLMFALGEFDQTRPLRGVPR